MVSETQKRRNRTATRIVDCRLSIVDCRLDAGAAGGSSVANRKSPILRALESVTDPEIPVLSIVDMGMVAHVRIEREKIAVDITPTFVGCPAVGLIRESVAAALAAVGETDVTVNIVFDPPWTSDRITPAGREKLREFGVAPPGPRCGAGQLTEPTHVPCPFCGSLVTELESLFGPTLCRSIHYCHRCLQSFEHFKPV